MDIDEAMRQGLDSPATEAEGVLAHALASANSEVDSLKVQLASAQGEAEGLREALDQSSVTERQRIAEAFETSSSAFPEGLTVETLVFMLRLGT